MHHSSQTFNNAIASLIQTKNYTLSAMSPKNSYSTMDGKSELQRWSSLIGIITAITGNILISFALNIQRYAHLRLHQERSDRRERLKNIGKRNQGGYGTNGISGTNGHINGQDGNGDEEDNPLQSSYHSKSSEEDEDYLSSYLRSPYWWAGIVLMTVGEAGNFLAYGFAPASIVSPLGVVALISNCVIAPIMLKEPFRLRDFWGVVVAVAGAVVVVLSAKQEEKKLGPHEIWGAITTMEFEIYMAATAALIFVLAWASPRYGNKTILIDLGLVGLFGGYTALSTKGVSSMLSSTLWRALTTPITYALLAVLVSTAVMQIKYVNKALQRFDSTQVIPIQFVTFTLSVIIGSAILYRDFEKATPDSVGKFIGGCLLTFFGVFLITSGRNSRDDEGSEESDGEGEERLNLLAQHDQSHENQQKHPDYSSIRLRPHAPHGDGVSDDTDSRRSSRVSFIEQPSLPRTSNMYSNLPYQQSSRPVPTIIPTEVVDDEDPATPGTTWKAPTDDFLHLSRHPGLLSAISTPQLPSEAQTSTSNTLEPPSLPPRTSSQGNVHTHPNFQSSPNPPQADRPMTPRLSISRMMPGLLISPISGGLSAVVADELMRGVDSPTRSVRSKSLRRPRGLPHSNSGSQRHSRLDLDGEESEYGVSPSKSGPPGPGLDLRKTATSTNEQTSDQWSRMTRARSLSHTLGDLFRGRRHGSERPNTASDEEAGPSGP